MNINQDIANIFYEIADILQLKEIKFKPQAYILAAQSLENLKEDVYEIYLKKGKGGLEEIPGIGKRLADKIIEYLENEKIKEFEDLKKSVPKALYTMMDIPGVGAKKAKLFYDILKIKTIKELETAAKEHRLSSIRGFKEKSEENILAGIKRYKLKQHRIKLKNAEKIANFILKEIKKIKEVKKAEVAGSIRRRKETIGDIDIVILTNKSHKVADKFSKMNFIKEILNKGDEKVSVILKDNLQADLRFFSEEEYGAGLLYFTGDKTHNIWLRKIAIKKGLKLNEYGLFSGDKSIAGKTEKEIYDKLGVKYISPEKRIGEIN